MKENKNNQTSVGVLNDEILTEKWFSDNKFIKSEKGYWELETPYGVFSILPDLKFRKGEYIYEINIMLVTVRCLFLAYDMFKEKAHREKVETEVKETNYHCYDAYKQKVKCAKDILLNGMFNDTE